MSRIKKPRWTSRRIKQGHILSLWAGRSLVYRAIVLDGIRIGWDGPLLSYGGRAWHCCIHPFDGTKVEEVKRRAA